MLPRSLAADLRQHMLAARALWALTSAGEARRRGRSACTEDQIPRRGTTLRLVLGVLRFIPFGGPAHGCLATPSPL